MSGVCSALNERLEMLKVSLSVIQRDQKAIKAELVRKNEDHLKKRYEGVLKIKRILDSLDMDDEERPYTEEAYRRVQRKYLYWCARHEAFVNGKSGHEMDIVKFIETLSMLKD